MAISTGHYQNFNAISAYPQIHLDRTAGCLKRRVSGETCQGLSSTQGPVQTSYHEACKVDLHGGKWVEVGSAGEIPPIKGRRHIQLSCSSFLGHFLLRFRPFSPLSPVALSEMHPAPQLCILAAGYDTLVVSNLCFLFKWRKGSCWITWSERDPEHEWVVWL